MTESKLKLPNFWSHSHTILTMPRGKDRTFAHHLVVIETLRVLEGEAPTRDELQTLSRIRRKRFIAVLKYLLEIQSVIRIGSGTRFDPYRYVLSEKERRR